MGKGGHAFGVRSVGGISQNGSDKFFASSESEFATQNRTGSAGAGRPWVEMGGAGWGPTTAHENMCT